MIFKKTSSEHAVVALSVAGLIAGGGSPAIAQIRNAETKIEVPAFSELAKSGKIAFEQVCAKCHGTNALGTDKGPPLLHQIYNPGHHGDASIYRAIKYGSRQHHWRFGNMPPQPNVSDQQINAIIRYIRELQAANGIVFRRHRM